MRRIQTIEDYHKAYTHSIENPEEFWAEQAQDFWWHKKWDKILNWNFIEPKVEWFIGGKLNITENCLDRHLQNRANQTAIIWEPNDDQQQAIHITYQELYQDVCKFANVLKRNGIQKGDRVCIYMPMIPELAVAVLACARIGAIHSVVFAGFAAASLKDRILDARAKAVITAQGLNRGDKKLSIKKIVDEAIEGLDFIEKVIVAPLAEKNSSSWDCPMQAGRDLWLNEELTKVEAHCPAEIMDSEDPLFILYTSGSTGKPKGVLHTCGGYMVYTDYSFRNVFQHNEGDIYWCTADIGWITGHSYIVYAPLLSGSTTVMFEGIPTYPDAGRFWSVIAKHKVNIFYTAPTAIRALMLFEEKYIQAHDLSSLKVLGSVGEPINEEAWEWYFHKIGKGKCPIVDTWWQTETGGIMISPLAAITPLIPSYATLPLPGILPVLLDQEGKEIDTPEAEGYLCIKAPWPSILRTTYGDHERCRLNYFAQYPGYYFTGDGAKRDAQGNYRIIGRIDDVINVSGHRFGTAEIENAINENEFVIESAVVGYPHEIKGQGIYAFVIATPEGRLKPDIAAQINETVIQKIGKIARLDKIQIVAGLPKTRSGKIMRRILRKIAEGDTSNLGDTSTLLDPSVVELILASKL